ncbi:hypothetical protein NBRC116589_04210 [Ruegeria sp. HU-ET01832]
MKIDFSGQRGRIESQPLVHEAGYYCAPPETFVLVSFRQKLTSWGFDIRPFLQTDSNPKNVTIRRSGEVMEDQIGTRFRREVSSARFTNNTLLSQEFWAESTLFLSGKIYFCEYSGFLAFVRAKIDMTGKVGNFGVQSQWSLDPSTNQLRIVSRYSKVLSEEGAIKDISFLGLRGFRTPDIGRAELEFFAADVDFDLIDGEGTIPIDVRASFYVDLTLPRETHE